MTNTCIDDVAVPMKKLQLLPEELVTLKIIMFCQFGNTLNLPGIALKIVHSLFLLYRGSIRHYKQLQEPGHERSF
jgi:hypothetical protein